MVPSVLKHFHQGELTINGVQCVRNAAEYGGCISLLGSLFISKSTMKGNNAGVDGGAMVVTSGNIQIHECQFSDNFAAYGGVLVYTYNLFDVQTKSKIEKNVHFHSANITASTFSNNTATYAGGVFLTAAIKGQILNLASDKSSNGSSTITSDIYRHKFLLRVSHSNLTHSQARFGGVLYGTSGNVLFDDCRIESNSASAGGVCYCRFATCSINSSIVQHNLVSVEGGVIMQAEQYLIYTIEHAFFWNNSALYGGVLSTKSDIKVMHSTFRSNFANDGGAMVLNIQNLSTIFNTTFTNHAVRHNGGAIVLNGGRIKISQCQFENNSAGNEGGALILDLKTSDLYCSIIQCDFLHNSATIGGAVAIEGGYLTIFESNFNNKAKNKGGSIYQGKGELVLDQSKIQESAARQGGAVFHSSGEMHLTYSQIANNSATYLGGGIYDESKHLRLSYIDLVNNRAMNGTALYKLNGEIVMQKINIKSNSNTNNSNSLLLAPTVSDKSSSSTLSVVQGKFLDIRDYRLECPVGFTPKQSAEGMGRPGVYGALKLYCEACLYRYQYLDTKGVLENGIHPRNESSSADLKNQCKTCPKGADCAHTEIRSLPGYWGYKHGSSFRFVRCPSKYCCEESPCAGAATCAEGRYGTLCGRCLAPNYTESLFTKKCVSTKACVHGWAFAATVFIAMFYAIAMLLHRDFKNQIVIIFSILKGDETRGVNYFRNRNKKIFEKQPKSRGVKADAENETIAVSVTGTVGRVKGMKLDANRHTVAVSNTTSSNGNNMTNEEPKKENLTEKKKDTSSKSVQLLLYYIQDAQLFSVSYANLDLDKGYVVRTAFLGLAQFSLDIIILVSNVCIPEPFIHPTGKLLLKSIIGPVVLLMYALGFLMVKNMCSLNMKNKLYPRMVTATLLITLFSYQKIIFTTFTLLKCVTIGDRRVMFVDGHVTCFSSWQFIFFFVVIFNFFPFTVSLLFLPWRLAEGHISLKQFFIACLFPVPFLIYWLISGRYQSQFKSQKKQKHQYDDACTNAVLKIFHNAYNDISVPFLGKISWVGVIKCRRLAMILVYAFVETPLYHVVLLLTITLVHLIHHTIVKPYRDNSTGLAAIFSMLATFAIAIVNLIRATLEFVEYKLSGRDEVLLQILDVTEDVLLVWFPLLLITLCGVGALFYATFMIVCGPESKAK